MSVYHCDPSLAKQLYSKFSQPSAHHAECGLGGFMQEIAVAGHAAVMKSTASFIICCACCGLS